MKQAVFAFILLSWFPLVGASEFPVVYLWSCKGEVLLAPSPAGPAEPLETCTADMMHHLPTGSRLEVVKGRAILTDGQTLVTLDPVDKPTYQVKVAKQAKSQRDGMMHRLFSYFFYSNRGDAILKGDDDQIFSQYPYLEIVDDEGPVLDTWEGFAMWHNLPNHRPIALRVSSDDELVWGPEVLIEPIFDLSELADLGIDHAQLELMIIDSPYLPNTTKLSFPLGHLLSLRGQPVPAVLLSEVRLTSAQSDSPPDEELERFVEQLATEEQGPMLEAIAAAHGQRLRTARGLLREHYGEDIPLPWQRATSGLVVVGEYTMTETRVPACLDGQDADELWNCFWETLGPAVVPEILPGDFSVVSKIRDRLEALEPEGWRAPVASAQLDLLLAQHTSAIDHLKLADSRCTPDSHCTNTVILLENLVLYDRNTNFSRGISPVSFGSHEPGYLLRGRQIVRPSVPLDATTQGIYGLWLLAGRVRQERGFLQMLRYRLDQEAFENDAQDRKNGLKLLGGEGRAGELLAWSISPDGTFRDLPQELQAAAAQLYAETLLTPNGSFGAADVMPPIHSEFFHQEGSFPPTRIDVDSTTFEQGFETLAYYRGTTNHIAAARRLASVAAAAISLGEFAPAQAYLAQLEMLLELASSPPQEVAILHLLRARLAVGMEIGDCLSHLRQSLAALEGNGGPGRIESLLLTWKELAQQVFHHQKRYREGLELMDGASRAAAESGFLKYAVEMQLSALGMLNDLRLYSEALQRSDAAIDLSFELVEEIQDRNKTILAEIEAGKLPRDSAAIIEEEPALGLLLQLANMRVVAMSNLALSWSDEIEPQIDELKKHYTRISSRSSTLEKAPELGDPVTKLFWRISWATSKADFSSAEKLAMEGPGDGPFDDVLALSRGDLSPFERREERMASYQNLAAELGEIQVAGWLEQEDKVGALSHIDQQLMQERELYFQLAADLGHPGKARQQMEHWEDNPLTSSIVASRPWRQHHVEAQVLEAEGRLAEALKGYEQLADDLLQLFYSGHHRNLYHRYILALEDAFLGSARTAWDLSKGRDAVKALDRLDLLRWLSDERKLHDLRHLSPTPFPGDLQALAEDLGPGGSLVVIGGLGRYREVFAWIISKTQGVRAKRFVGAPKDLFFKEGLWHSVDGEPATGMIRELTSWLDSQVPPDTPVALIADGELRRLGVHLLSVGGEPLPLRNPLVVAPSLRTLATALENQSRGQGKAIVGLSLSSDTQEAGLHRKAGDYMPLVDRARLRIIAAGATLDWGEKATVERVEAVLAEKARVHLSTHGTVNPIDPERTGLVLYAGELLDIERAGQMTLPGSLVILSACQSGEGGDPAGNTASTLDAIFLARGARAVVSTTDKVRPEVAALWMQSFHSALDSGQSPMHAAQHAYKVTSQEFSSPWEWGAFSVVGAGVGRF